MDIKRGSFTLIEVIVSVVIISIVSLGSYLAYIVVSGAVEGAINRAKALILAQQSLEEIRGYVREQEDNFDQLDSYSLKAVGSEFNKFSRNLYLTSEAGSSELKRVQLGVSWIERGGEQSYNFTMLFARPPQPLPANIHGNVTDKEKGNPISGVEVKVVHKDDPDCQYITYTDINGSYTFADPLSGNFRLKTGEWQLTAGNREGYYDYTHPTQIHLISGEDEEVNISLEPKPDPGYINGTLIDKDGSTFPQYLTLYQAGKSRQTKYSGDGSFSFKIEFDNATERKCFTLVTSYYKNDWSYPYRFSQHCGDFCDPHGWGKSYNYRGWSSAVVQADGSKTCSNPWFGSSSVDRLCVGPGEVVNVKISLVSVPTATLRGYVFDNKGQPIEGAYIYVRWHNWGYWSPYPAGYTKENGYYEVTVPASQELFPDGNSYFLKIMAGTYLPIAKCCDTTGTVWTTSGWQEVGPFYKGDVKNRNFIIPLPSDEKCGDADGYVIDGMSGTPLSGVEVKIDRWVKTDNMGHYEFRCPPETKDKKSIPIGNYWVDAKKTGYYYFQSDGNRWYSYQGRIKIEQNKTTTYKTIKLWPKGYGQIKGRVGTLVEDTFYPLSGAKVVLGFYDGGTRTVFTDDEGKFKFNNAIETWPPEGVKGDSYYNQNVFTHSLEVSKYLYKSVKINSIKLKAGEELDLGDIVLTPQTGGL